MTEPKTYARKPWKRRAAHLAARHDCQLCGTWVCPCGTKTPYASRFAKDPLKCPTCQKSRPEAFMKTMAHTSAGTARDHDETFIELIRKGTHLRYPLEASEE